MWQVVGSKGSQEKARGLHTDVTIRIIDEASGVDDEFFNTMLSGLTSGVNIVLLLGNPVKTTGFFCRDIFKRELLQFFQKEHIIV